MPALLKIQAVVKRVIFQSTAWSSIVFSKGENERDVFTAIGCLPDVSPGQVLTLAGEWRTHERYGEQFAVSDIVSDAGASSPKPTESVPKSYAKSHPIRLADMSRSKEGIIRFLSSSFIKGIGPEKAATVYAAFGSKVFNIIQHSPDKLMSISGIGKKVSQDIVISFDTNSKYLPLRAALESTVTDNQIRDIYCKYNTDAISQLERDPYRLIDDVDGFGFSKADKVALACGIPPDSPCRIKGAVIHSLNEFSNEGHCFSFSASILDYIDKYIGKFPNLITVLADIIKDMAMEFRVHVDDDGSIWPMSLYNAECSVAQRINELSHPKSMFKDFSSEDVDCALLDVKESTVFELEETQRRAVSSVYKHPFSIITGGPGTGKTTIIKAILHVWTHYASIEAVSMMAPTGKASRRITEVTGRQAYTIHQQTGVSVVEGIIKYTVEPEKIGLIIVDEGSMIDIKLACRLFTYAVNGTRVVIIGDKDQLPSIGPGNFFWELCRANVAVPKVELALSFRQHGSIATNAFRLNNGSGVHSFVQDDSFRFIKAAREDTQAATLSAYYELVDEFGAENVCLLSPMRRKGTACTDVLNKLIQEHINQPSSAKEELVANYTTFRVGDRVVCNHNMWDRNIANGDIGNVINIVSEGGPKKSLEVVFDSGVVALLPFSCVSHLTLAYSLTVHKSQGSEYRGVVFVFGTEHWYMGQRNLLYTAVTRAREKLRIVGDARAIAAAINKNDAPHRNTKLKERLQA